MNTRRERILTRVREIEDQLERLAADLSGLNGKHAEIAHEHITELRNRLEDRDAG